MGVVVRRVLKRPVGVQRRRVRRPTVVREATAGAATGRRGSQLRLVPHASPNGGADNHGENDEHNQDDQPRRHSFVVVVVAAA